MSDDSDDEGRPRRMGRARAPPARHHWHNLHVHLVRGARRDVSARHEAALGSVSHMHQTWCDPLRA